MISNETTYMEIVREGIKTDNPEITEYLTTICPECDKTPPAGENSQTVGFHKMIDEWVIVGCEGYRVINPNVTGDHVPNWVDWR